MGTMAGENGSSDDLLNRSKLLVWKSPERSRHEHTQVASIRNFGTTGSYPVDDQTEFHRKEL